MCIPSCFYSHTTPPVGPFFPFPQDHPGSFTEDLVLATPEVREHVLEDGDDFLVLATDGLWDVLTPQNMCHALRRFKARYQMDHANDDGDELDQEALCLFLAEELTRLALRLGSADNITVTVIAFQYT
jgi:protein phosphatase 2C